MNRINQNNSNDSITNNHEKALLNNTRFTPDQPSTETYNKPLTTKKISPATTEVYQQPNSLSADYRYEVGGKGMFLTAMQQAKLPVPEFLCLDIKTINTLEESPIPLTLVNQYFIDIKSTSDNISITQLKYIIYNCNQEDRQALIDSFNKLLTSSQLYIFLKNTPISKKIQNIYHRINPDNQKAIIVRSSGINEDNFSDAQAGKYHSKVHGKGEILTTILELIFANLTADITNNNKPVAVSMVLQQVVKSKMGGVIISYSSIEDNSIRVEFAPGQPKGAVCGQADIIPHSCTITRTDERLNSSCLRGDITKQFVLEQQGDSFLETERPYIEDLQDHLLSKESIHEITSCVQKLESLLKCPVDIEFAIDENNHLHIVQVRPITKLLGATNFAIDIPSNPICNGELISEGVASGNIFFVHNDDDLDKVPDGAIVVANHATDAMLTDDFFTRVSGFVFKNCGANDHVAITLRQANKPCLLFKGNDFSTLIENDNQQTTIVAGFFNKKPGAYILAGNQVDTLKLKLTSANNIDSLVNYYPQPLQPAPQFSKVDEGFQLLHEQNTKLLNFYRSSGIFNECLSAKNLLLISISPDRDKIIQNLMTEIKLFNHELTVLLDILEQYIQLGITETTPNDIKNKLLAYQQEITVLRDKSSILETQIKFLTDTINIFHDSNNYVQLGNFDKWLQDCELLSDKLAKLYRPNSADQVDSLHDLIFWVHKIFVHALNEVAIGSGQGKIVFHSPTNECNRISEIEFNSPTLLTNECKQEIYKITANTTIVHMPYAAIANFELGYHVSIITMLENAEAAKGRTLRLNFTDNFAPRSYLNGKINRIFLLSSLFKRYIDIDEANFTIDTNETTGTIICEFTNIENKELMQQWFRILVSLLKISAYRNLDVTLDRYKLKIDISFADIKSILTNKDSIKNEFSFHRLLSLAYNLNYDLKNIELLTEEEVKLFSIWSYLDQDNNRITELAKKDLTLIEEKALFHYLFAREYALDKIRNQNKWIKNKDLIVNQLQTSGETLEYLPEQYQKDKYYVTLATSSNIESLKFADKSLLDDESFMLPLIKNNSHVIYYASDRLKNKPEFVLPALKQNGYMLKYCGDNVKNDKSSVLTAMKAPFVNLDKSKEKFAYDFVDKKLKYNLEIIHLRKNLAEQSLINRKKALPSNFHIK